MSEQFADEEFESTEVEAEEVAVGDADQPRGKGGRAATSVLKGLAGNSLAQSRRLEGYLRSINKKRNALIACCEKASLDLIRSHVSDHKELGL